MVWNKLIVAGSVARLRGHVKEYQAVSWMAIDAAQGHPAFHENRRSSGSVHRLIRGLPCDFHHNGS
jgi:hypothetical protein